MTDFTRVRFFHAFLGRRKAGPDGGPASPHAQSARKKAERSARPQARRTLFLLLCIRKPARRYAMTSSTACAMASFSQTAWWRTGICGSPAI